MLNIDYAAHNEYVREVWRSYDAGTPIKTPVILGINPRIWLLDPTLNTGGITFARYSADPAVMLDVQLRFHDYVRHNLIADHPMGLPAEGWAVRADLQNVYETAWLGAQVVYPANNSPYAVPFLTDENKYAFVDRPIPDAYAGCMAWARMFCDYARARVAAGHEYRGIPLTSVHPPVFGTDGPMTVACNLRGTGNFCVDLIEEPEYADALLSYLTDAIITRVRAQRTAYGLPARAENYGFADDDIALLSCEMYRERVLPCHKRLVDALGTPGRPVSVHLCGDATRHFLTLRDTLNVQSFDTGYPVRFGELARALGPDVRINGGVRADRLLTGTPVEIEREARGILGEVAPYTKRFVLREANNLSPCTPPENAAALYRATL